MHQYIKMQIKVSIILPEIREHYINMEAGYLLSYNLGRQTVKCRGGEGELAILITNAKETQRLLRVFNFISLSYM